jgi:hypothetical protein
LDDAKGIREYVILYGTGALTSVKLDSLTAKVNEYIGLGWKIKGSMKSVKGTPTQTMVKIQTESL